jgi:integration host factor subunit alpha
MHNTLTRSDLAQAVKCKVGLPQTEAAQIVNSVLSELSELIISGETVKLNSFGVFRIRKKSERPGRNPKTMIDATVSARRVVVFKPSKILKARMNIGRKKASPSPSYGIVGNRQPSLEAAIDR